jgi:hypothetical protein
MGLATVRRRAAAALLAQAVGGSESGGLARWGIDQVALRSEQKEGL